MKRNIIIVDDFYADPQEVRDFALKQDYPDPGEDYTYPGKNSGGSFYSEEIHRRFEEIVDQKLTPAQQNGYFRISLENDSLRQDVHVDPCWEWGAVLYMSDPKDTIDEGGTSFWMHNKTKMEFCPTSDEESKIYGYPSRQELWWTTVYGDGLDRSKWTRTLLCPMKFNRLVIFRSNLWHSHNYNFGTDLNNGRLVQLFFFNHTEFYKE